MSLAVCAQRVTLELTFQVQRTNWEVWEVYQGRVFLLSISNQCLDLPCGFFFGRAVRGGQLSGHTIWFNVMQSGSSSGGKIEASKEYGTKSFPNHKSFSHLQISKVLMVCPENEGIFLAL